MTSHFSSCLNQLIHTVKSHSMSKSTHYLRIIGDIYGVKELKEHKAKPFNESVHNEMYTQN